MDKRPQLTTCQCNPQSHYCDQVREAAPALLAALEATIRMVEGQPSPAECLDDKWIDKGIKKARAAIRAAKGEK